MTVGDERDYFSFSLSLSLLICTVAALDNKYRHLILTRNGHGSEVVGALGFER